MMRKNRKSYKSVKESERNVSYRKITINLLLVSLLCVLVFFACSPEKEENASQNGGDPGELTEEKCVNFAQQLHLSFADSNSTYLNEYLNWQAIASEVTKNDPLRAEILEVLLEKYDVANDFIQFTYSEADVRFITYYQEENHHYIVFRVFEQPQSLNVYEFELKGNSEEIYVADVYDYSSAASVISSLSEEVDFWSEKGENWMDFYAIYEQVQLEFSMLMSQGNLKDAFLLTKQYTDHYSELKRFRQLYGLICEQSGSKELMLGYLDDELQRIPLMEKGRWLPLFYLRSIEGNYGEALIALSNLENEIGADVYLDFLKGNLYFELGDYESAVAFFNNALAADNSVLIFHLGKIHSYIEQSKYVEAAEALLVMDDTFDVSQYDWDLEFAEYPDFLTSVEYQEFKVRITT